MLSSTMTHSDLMLLSGSLTYSLPKLLSGKIIHFTAVVLSDKMIHSLGTVLTCRLIRFDELVLSYRLSHSYRSVLLSTPIDTDDMTFSTIKSFIPLDALQSRDLFSLIGALVHSDSITLPSALSLLFDISFLTYGTLTYFDQYFISSTLTPLGWCFLAYWLVHSIQYALVV